MLKVRQSRNYFFKPTILPKTKRTNLTLLLWYLRLILFFWKKLKTPKRHFEINWPLDATYLWLDWNITNNFKVKLFGVLLLIDIIFSIDNKMPKGLSFRWETTRTRIIQGLHSLKRNGKTLSWILRVSLNLFSPA